MGAFLEAELPFRSLEGHQLESIILELEEMGLPPALLPGDVLEGELMPIVAALPGTVQGAAPEIDHAVLGGVQRIDGGRLPLHHPARGGQGVLLHDGA
ncbi:MAG: hypothetical protein KDB93_10400, partial [Flavobacteriales bacterium]|nr:hypothetical protein [Flavobacteriales bacterium]